MSAIWPVKSLNRAKLGSTSPYAGEERVRSTLRIAILRSIHIRNDLEINLKALRRMQAERDAKHSSNCKFTFDTCQKASRI